MPTHPLLFQYSTTTMDGQNDHAAHAWLFGCSSCIENTHMKQLTNIIDEARKSYDELCAYNDVKDFHWGDPVVRNTKSLSSSNIVVVE